MKASSGGNGQTPVRPLVSTPGECVKRASEITFTHSFAGIAADAHCLGAFLDGTSEGQRNPGELEWSRPGWGRRGGDLRRRRNQFRQNREARPSVLRASYRKAVSGPAAPSSPVREVRTAKYHRVGCVCRYADGAAGPEWRLTPTLRSLALERGLVQQSACYFSRIARISGCRSAQAYRPLRPSRGISETPFPLGTVSFSFGDPFGDPAEFRQSTGGSRTGAGS